jgi:hypothetical protein
MPALHPSIQLTHKLLLLCWPALYCAVLLCRLWFAIEPEMGELFLVKPDKSSNNSRSISGCSSNRGSAGDGGSLSREGLPAWVGAQIPVIPAACSAAAGAYSRAQVTKLLEECCSIKVTPAPRSSCSMARYCPATAADFALYIQPHISQGARALTAKPSSCSRGSHCVLSDTTCMNILHSQ